MIDIGKIYSERLELARSCLNYLAILQIDNQVLYSKEDEDVINELERKGYVKNDSIWVRNELDFDYQDAKQYYNDVCLEYGEMLDKLARSDKSLKDLEKSAKSSKMSAIAALISAAIAFASAIITLILQCYYNH